MKLFLSFSCIHKSPLVINYLGSGCEFGKVFRLRSYYDPVCHITKLSI